MPTYRNDSETSSYRINDANDIVQNVRPGESIETYEPDVPDDFTETSESPSVDKDISGENVFTDSIKPKGRLNISISGQFDGEIELQRSWDDFTTVKVVDAYTVSIETSIEDEDPNVKYRLGIPVGKFVDGSVNIKLAR